MKVANFKLAGKRRTLYGSITEKADGKFTISVHNSRSNMGAENDQVRSLARKIIESNFIHEAVYDLVDTGLTKSSKLVELLREHTQDLKKEFLERTRIYAETDFEKAEKLLSKTSDWWYEKYKVQNPPPPYSYKSVEWNTYSKNSREMQSAREKLKNITYKGLEAYVSLNLKYAEEHYESSLMKLATRLKEKGVTESTELKIKSGRVAENFECTIFHDGKTTIAWTIIASGPVQRPHYRYLVK